MNRGFARVALVALALVLPGAAAAEGVRVLSDGGNVFVERDGAKTQLTVSARDAGPVLSPDGTMIVFTRQARTGADADDDQFCDAPSAADELRAISIDGKNDRVLLRGHKGEGGKQLCGFHDKQFSSDGRSLYFLTPGWATSSALHVYDMRQQSEHFMMPANDVLVLSFCKDKYKDALAVQQHRYFVFGGSYDWYWLYDAAGKKQLGPLGEFDSSDDIGKRAKEEWCQ